MSVLTTAVSEANARLPFVQRISSIAIDRLPERCQIVLLGSLEKVTTGMQAPRESAGNIDGRCLKKFC